MKSSDWKWIAAINISLQLSNIRCFTSEPIKKIQFLFLIFSFLHIKFVHQYSQLFQNKFSLNIHLINVRTTFANSLWFCFRVLNSWKISETFIHSYYYFVLYYIVLSYYYYILYGSQGKLIGNIQTFETIPNFTSPFWRIEPSIYQCWLTNYFFMTRSFHIIWSQSRCDKIYDFA